MAAIALSSAFAIVPLKAVQPDEVLSDPALEQRARTLSRELRCMVCQNQSIDDSDAPLARDLRILVRDRLKAGDGDGDVLNFLTTRYGEFVLLKPRFSWHTALLWLTPPLLLISGALVLIFIGYRRSDRANRTVGQEQRESALSAAEQDRIAELLRQR
ncbi:MAG TPA: cytochrome c-type biogenesis protein [Xanthobacteraceae bacterium]|nr:cytochrome c-type biogenesis protein [Xanthobacteraceae bacterium]